MALTPEQKAKVVNQLQVVYSQAKPLAAHAEAVIQNAEALARDAKQLRFKVNELLRWAKCVENGLTSPY